MNKKFLYLTLFAATGFFGYVPAANGQYMPDYLQRELQRTNEIIQETNEYLEEVIYPLAQEQQIYEQQLFNACSAGNNNACTELASIERRRTQWMIENNCRYRTSLNSCYR
jgi:predicted transcriptional regulator